MPAENSSAPDEVRTEPSLRSSPDERVVRVGSPASLLALVPNILGFTPSDCLVVIGAEPPRGRVRLTLRFDLPKTPDPAVADEVARHVLAVLTAQGFDAGVALGYGPGTLVTPVADALRSHAAQAGFRLAEVLRASDGRYWSYLCTDPECCPPEGVPYDVAGHPVTAAFSAAGMPAPLATREELAATVAALDGEAGDSMDQATRQAQERAARLTAGTDGTVAARRLIGAAGLDAVHDAIGTYRAGGELSSDTDAAWLSVTLRELRVRDDAWARMDPDHADAHLRLWTDLTRRARPGHVAAPASLLAFVAWQRGNGALANVALDRALADDPDYSMAKLMREVIDAGAPPRMARLPMTPDEVAASYAEQDAGETVPGEATTADDTECSGAEDPDECQCHEDPSAL